jgi:hypothetical protein
LSQLKIIALPNVLQSIKNYSKSTNIILFIDESILPLDKLSDKERGRILSSLADLQSNDIHIVFTSLRQDTFESLTTPSGRKILQVVMNNLNLSDSVNLINNFIKILNGKKNIIRVNLNHNDLVHRDKQIKTLAMWTGGVPRLCEYAAITINEPKGIDIFNSLYEKYRSKYSCKSQFIPREVVVLALIGLELNQQSIYKLTKHNSTVDSCIYYGFVLREHGNLLYLTPLFLKYFCEYNNGDIDQVYLIKEINLILSCITPNSDGKQFERFDRAQYRIMRLIRFQFKNDLINNLVKVESIEFAVNPLKHFQCDVNWGNASLSDYFGPFAQDLNYLIPEYNTLKFDLSSALPDDISFKSIPSPEDKIFKEKKFISGTQFYPESYNNEGFDWFAVFKQLGTNKLFVVVTENKFSFNIDNNSNSININKDILDKFNATKKIFEDAGWKNDQIIFRLAAHRHIWTESLNNIPDNVVISGPDDFKQKLSPSLLKIFETVVYNEYGKRQL